MGRPFAIIGFSMFASLFFICALGVTCAYVLAAVCALVLVLMLSVRRLRRYKAVVVAAAAVLLACVLFCGRFYFVYRPCLQYFGKPVKISATLSDYPDYKYDTYYLEAKVTKINGEDVKPFGVRLSMSEIADAAPGDTLQCNTTLHCAGSAAKFSQLNYLSKGIFATGYSSEEPVIESSQAQRNISITLADYRHAIAHSLQRLMPQNNAALATAVLIGEKSYIASDSLEQINAAGISHIICVSGLHLSILGFGVIRFFGALRVSRKLKYLAAGAFIVFFMALCGFSNSVVRAGLMFLVFIAAELLLAEPDSLNSLGFAASMILLNPFSAGNIGFIFSFLATFSIICVGSKITQRLKDKWSISKKRRYQRALFSLLEILIISVVVNAFCLPFSILIFQKVGLIGIVANVLILPFATILLIASGLSAFFGLFAFSVTDIAAYPAAWIASLLCRYVYAVCRLLAQLPYSNLYAGSTICILLCVMWIIGMALLFMMRRRKAVVRCIAAVLAVLLAAGSGAQLYQDAHRVQIAVHALGNNVCISVNCGKDYILIDAGNNPFTFNKVKERMFASNADNIDYFFITSTARNQSSKAEKILKNIPVAQCYLPRNSTLEEMTGTAVQTLFDKTDYIRFTTDSGMTISYYALKFSAIQIAFYNQSVLFLNNAAADISVLPEHMQHFDYLIVCANTNNSFSNLKTNAIIEIRKERDTEHEALLQKVCKRYFATDTLQDILITLDQKQSTIGSTNEWQQ